MRRDGGPAHTCSFCGELVSTVDYVQGHAVGICRECCDLAYDILHARDPSPLDVAARAVVEAWRAAGENCDGDPVDAAVDALRAALGEGEPPAGAP